MLAASPGFRAQKISRTKRVIDKNKCPNGERGGLADEAVDPAGGDTGL
jgi:hypothetical protein